MSINRYTAIKRLNKLNFINLLSACSEDTLNDIFPVRKHDLLKLISDRLTKHELQDIMYNLQEIDTKNIISEYQVRVQQLAINKEELKDKESNTNTARIPEFATEQIKKVMSSYVQAYKKCKGDKGKQQDLISVIREKSKQDVVTFYNSVFTILRQRQIPEFDEIHRILMQALSVEQQNAIRISITELELQT